MKKYSIKIQYLFPLQCIITISVSACYPVNPQPTTRKIIHCDCDCFYASVEMRDNPALRDIPLAIGGRADQRGVIATCNYQARSFGVRSAQPTSQALQRCPQLVVMHPNMEKYRIASRQILAIYHDYTDLVEPLSLDEAFLDVSHAQQHQGSATLIAQEIRQRIADEVGITASAGVAPNKFLAKIASDWNKPNGQFVIRPAQVEEFVASLPVGKIFGVGKVTAARLKQLQLHTCADLQACSPHELQHHFGKLGERMYQLCRGIDERAVCPNEERKSVSVEETYTPDVPDLATALGHLPELYASLLARIARTGSQNLIHKLYVKIRFNNFKITTVECVGHQADLQQFQKLLALGFARRARPMRLLGLGVRLDAPRQGQQLELFPPELASE